MGSMAAVTPPGTHGKPHPIGPRSPHYGFSGRSSDKERGFLLFVFNWHRVVRASQPELSRSHWVLSLHW